MDDERFDELMAELERMCAASERERARQIIAGLGEAPPVEMTDATVVLLGYEGQVDVAWDVPPPRPETLRRPLQHRVRDMLDPDDPPEFPVATYRRVGDFTYRRES